MNHGIHATSQALMVVNINSLSSLQFSRLRLVTYNHTQASKSWSLILGNGFCDHLFKPTILLVLWTWNTLQIIYIAQIICAVARSNHQINKNVNKRNNVLGCLALKRETQLEAIAGYRDVMTQVHNTVRGTFQNTSQKRTDFNIEYYSACVCQVAFLQ